MAKLFINLQNKPKIKSRPRVLKPLQHCRSLRDRLVDEISKYSATCFVAVCLLLAFRLIFHSHTIQVAEIAF